MKKRSLFLALLMSASAVAADPVPDDPAKSLITRYSSEPDVVLAELFKAEQSGTPEARKQASETERAIYDRYELGIGTCDLGAEWSWRLDTRAGVLIAQIKVKKVTPDGPAAKAGLKPEDVIFLVDGKALEGDDMMVQWKARCALLEPGKTLPLEIRRGAKPLNASLVAGAASAQPTRKTRAGDFEEWSTGQHARLVTKKAG